MISEYTPDVLIPLSANYTYDDNINVKSTIAKWKDGYTTFVHPSFDTTVDVSLNNNTIFYLTTCQKLSSIIEDRSLSEIDLGDYVVFTQNSNYLTNVNTDLYFTATSSDNSFFRIILNSDKTVSFLNDADYYVTCSNNNPYDLTMQYKKGSNEEYLQKFNMYMVENKVYLTINIVNDSGVGPSNIVRYWGVTKCGTEAGKLRAIGTTQKDDYVFNITTINTNYKPTGLLPNHKWVSYHNEFLDTSKNKNVEINENNSINDIKVNHLFNLPYNSKININSRSMDVNFANMKNIKTYTYEYRKK